MSQAFIVRTYMTQTQATNYRNTNLSKKFMGSTKETKGRGTKFGLVLDSIKSPVFTSLSSASLSLDACIAPISVYPGAHLTEGASVSLPEALTKTSLAQLIQVTIMNQSLCSGRRVLS